MKFVQIKETCIYCKDLEKAKEFYAGLLELPVVSYVPGKHIFFKAGNSMLLCFNPDDSRHKKNPPPHFGEGNIHFAFEVPADEYERVKKEITAKHIPITATLVRENGQESFYFEDPEKNVLEVVPAGIWS